MRLAERSLGLPEPSWGTPPPPGNADGFSDSPAPDGGDGTRGPDTPAHTAGESCIGLRPGWGSFLQIRRRSRPEWGTPAGNLADPGGGTAFIGEGPQCDSGAGRGFAGRRGTGMQSGLAGGLTSVGKRGGSGAAASGGREACGGIMAVCGGAAGDFTDLRTTEWMWI